MKPPRPIVGILSLIALAGAVCVGFFSTKNIALHTEEMASLGAIAGLGFGLIASIPSLVLAVIGLVRHEQPRWPAVLGLLLSAAPAAFGVWILISLGSHH